MKIIKIEKCGECNYFYESDEPPVEGMFCYHPEKATELQIKNEIASDCPLPNYNDRLISAGEQMLVALMDALNELRYAHHHDEYCGCDKEAICSKQRVILIVEKAIASTGSVTEGL